MPLPTGTRLGPYEVLSPLGAGGMGEVYKARDTRLNRDVAIKILPRDFTTDPERLARFEREARTLAAFNHPHIGAIYGVERADDLRALVLELVDGQTLADRILLGRVPVPEALTIARQIADALDAAHEKGVIHRDLKPANIKITSAGVVKVLDFGLAKTVTGHGSGLDVSQSPTTSFFGTREGVILGTTAYMSPEHARGKPVDKRTDIWAFGCVLYETLTGRAAFAGDTVSDTIAAILEREPDWRGLPADTPPTVRRLLQRCLDKDPTRRLHDIADARVELDDALDAGRLPASSKRGPQRTTAWIAAAAAVALSLGLYATYSLLGQKSGAVPIELSFRQLTDQPGQEIYPSLSPDGRSVVYASRASGNWDIYLQRAGGKTTINLTKDSPADDTQPSFSPDGEQIAFRSEREGGGLFVMGATGENVKRVTDLGYHPAWSPDGKQIAFATGNFVNPLSLTVTGREGQLFVLDLITGERRVIPQPREAYQPHWSPRGHRIAYWGRPAGPAGPAGSAQRDLWTVASAGGAPVRVTSDAATDWNPVWSPDGRYLYFSSDRGGSMNFWKVAVDETSGEVLGPPEPVTTPSPYSGYLSFARVTGHVAYSQVIRSENVFKIAFDPSSGATIGRATAVTHGSRLITDADLSPDGQWLTFVSVGTEEDIFLVRTDGTGTRQLTAGGFKNRAPRWSPDGTQIAFHSDRGGKFNVWTTRPDGSGLRQVTDLPGTVIISSPIWSPDGTRIAFRTLSGLSVNVVGEPRRQETPPAIVSSQPGETLVPGAWSADGRRIAVSHLTSVRAAGISIYDFDANKLERLTEFGTSPRWLSDDRRLLFRHQDKVYLVDSRSRNVHELLSASPNIVESLSLSRDNRLLAYTIRITEADIWLAGPK